MENSKVYTVEEIRDILNRNRDVFEQKFSVDKFLLFGSYAKKQQTSDSDIDLLVSFTKPVDMFEFIDLQDYLAELFNKKIDLGTLSGLKTFIKDKILNEAIAL